MFAHIDADSFFASVLQRQNPSLKNKPLIASGMGGGCVIAASYEAKSKGVKTGMRISEARKLSPNLIVMPTDFAATKKASQELFALMERYCPGGVERASPDEGYLELHQVHSSPFDLELRAERQLMAHSVHSTLSDFAHSIQNDARDYLDLPISIGIAPTKTLAKMGSKYRKPKGIHVLDPKDIHAFLTDHHIGDVPGFGHKLTPKLEGIGIKTPADFIALSRHIVQKMLGKLGCELQDELAGIPVYKVITEPEPPKSISRCRSFRATNDHAFLWAQIIVHLQRCTSRLRQHGMECAGIGVWLRGADYKRSAFAERKLDRFASEESLLIPYAKELFNECCMSCIHSPRYSCTPIPDRPVLQSPVVQYSTPSCTQAGLFLSHLRTQGARQLSLFEETEYLKEAEDLQRALDTVRKRFGRESIVFGNAILAP